MKWLCVLALSLALAGAYRLQQPYEKHIQNGVEYRFKYTSHALTGIKTETGLKNGVRFDCDVIVVGTARNDIIIKLENAQLKKVSREITRPDLPLASDSEDQDIDVDVLRGTTLQQMLSKIIRVGRDDRLSYGDRIVMKVQRDAQDWDYSVNLKKAIASLLQISVDIENPEMQNATVTFHEDGIVGECETLYSMQTFDAPRHMNPWSLNITKIHNFDNCTVAPQARFIPFREQPFDDQITYNNTKEPLTGKRLSQTRYGLKVRDNRQSLDWARTFSIHDVTPATPSDTILATYVVQEIKLVSEQALPQTVSTSSLQKDPMGIKMTLEPIKKELKERTTHNSFYHFNPWGIFSSDYSSEQDLSLEDSSYDHEQQVSERQLESPKDKLRKVQKIVREIVAFDDESPKFVPVLMLELRRCDFNSLKVIFNYYVQLDTQSPEHKTMMDVWPKVWRSEAVLILKDAVRDNQIPIGQLTQMLVLMANNPKTNQTYITRLIEVCEQEQVREKSMTQRACVLTVGAHMYRVYLLPNKVSPSEKEQHIMWLKDLYTSASTPEQRLNVVKAMGNAGLKPFFPVLRNIIVTKPINYRLRIEAVKALHKMVNEITLKPQIENVLYPFVKDFMAGTDLRIECFKILMLTDLAPIKLRMLVEQLRVEPDTTFGSVLYTYVQQTARSQYPAQKARAQKARDALRFITPYPLRIRDASARFQESVNEVTKQGFMIKVITQDEQLTIPVPRSLFFVWSQFISGRSFNMMETGFDVTSWEQVAKELYDVIFRENQETIRHFNDLINQLNYVSRMASRTEGLVYFKYSDEELFFVTFAEIKQYLQENRRVVDRFLEGGKKEFNVWQTLVPVEAQEMVPTEMGLPLYRNTSTSILTKLQGDTEMNVQQPKSLRLNIDTQMKIFTENRIGLHLPGIEVGSKTVTLRKVNLPLSTSIALDSRTKELQMSVSLYQQTSDVRVVETQTRPIAYCWKPASTSSSRFSSSETQETEKSLAPNTAYSQRVTKTYHVSPLGFKVKYDVEEKVSPFLGPCATTVYTLQPYRSQQKLFDLNLKVTVRDPRNPMPHNSRVNIFDVEQPADLLELLNSNIRSKIEPERVFTRDIEQRLTSTIPTEKLGHVQVTYTLKGASIWEGDLKTVYSTDKVTVRFIYNMKITKNPETIESFDDSEICLDGDYQRLIPVLRSYVEDRLSDMKLKLNLKWGSTCQSSAAKTTYVEMHGRTVRSLEHDSDSQQLQQHVRQLERECEQEKKNQVVVKRACQLYATLLHSIVDLKVVAYHQELPEAVRDFCWTRYWYFKALNTAYVRSTNRQDNLRNIKMRINTMPSFAQPTANMIKIEWDDQQDMFQNIPCERVLGVWTPLLVQRYPILTTISKVVDPVSWMMSVFAPINIARPIWIQPRNEAVCKVMSSPQEVETFDGRVFRHALDIECGLILAANLERSSKQFVITKQQSKVKIELRRVEIELTHNIVKVNGRAITIPSDIKYKKAEVEAKVIELTKVQESIIVSLPQYNIEVLVDRRSNVMMKAEASLQQQLTGVCGHYDNNVRNDLMDPRGYIHAASLTRPQPIEFDRFASQFLIDAASCRASDLRQRLHADTPQDSYLPAPSHLIYDQEKLGRCTPEPRWDIRSRTQRRHGGSQICVPTEKIMRCPRDCQPSQTEQRRMPFHCFDTTEEAQRYENSLNEVRLTTNMHLDEEVHISC